MKTGATIFIIIILIIIIAFIVIYQQQQKKIRLAKLEAEKAKQLAMAGEEKSGIETYLPYLMLLI